MMKKIHDAIEDNDAEALQRTAHALKGMLGNFQVESAAQKAYDLEKMGRDGKTDQATKVFTRLTNDIDHLETIFLDLSRETSN